MTNLKSNSHISWKLICQRQYYKWEKKIYYEVNAVRETRCSYGEKLKLNHYFRVYTMTNYKWKWKIFKLLEENTKYFQ